MFDAIIRILALVSIATAQASTLTPVLNGEHIIDSNESDRRAVPFRSDEQRVSVMTSSEHVFAADVKTGAVLVGRGEHDVLPIASLTKLVTAMVVLDQGTDHLNQPVRFLEGDVKDDLHRIFNPGEEVTRRDALEALLVGSVNSAGNALARETIGRDAFVAAMNDKVRTMGLATPEFVDPTGISTQNRASAADVAAILTTALSYPEIRAVTEKTKVDITGKSGTVYRITSTNLLLGSYLNAGPFRIVGAKTGSLPDAGYSMAQVTRNPQGHEVVAVVLASPGHFNRYEDIKLLTGWVFDVFRWGDEDAGH